MGTIKSVWLNVRLPEDDREQLMAFYKNTTCPNFSEFVRKALFRETITVNHRNQSMDDFMMELAQLRKELNAIGKNINLAVRALQSAKVGDDTAFWIQEMHKNNASLQLKAGAIQERINQFASRWLQE